jgi:hypothetical protein
MEKEIDLTDNPVRVLKEMWRRRGLAIDPRAKAEMNELERLLGGPGLPWGVPYPSKDEQG